MFSVAFLFPRDLVWPQVRPYYIFNVLVLLLKNIYLNEIFSKHRPKVIIISHTNIHLKTTMKPDRTQVIWFSTHESSYLYLYGILQRLHSLLSCFLLVRRLLSLYPTGHRIHYSPYIQLLSRNFVLCLLPMYFLLPHNLPARTGGLTLENDTFWSFPWFLCGRELFLAF